MGQRKMIKKILSHFYRKMSSGSWLWRMGFKIFKNKEYNIIQKNHIFENIYRGKRCFILGNGPSLNEIDFASLENEVVFTVNMLMDHPDFLKLRSNYHVIADGTIFNCGDSLGLEENYYLKKFEILEACSGIRLFAPVEAKAAITNTNLDKQINVSYFTIGNPQKRINEFDLTNGVPSFNKVIHYAIGIATYMGFEKIYLLGCEETGILTYINLQLNNSTSNDHCYNENEKVKNSWRSQLKTYGMAWEYRQEAQVLDNYEKVYDLCEKRSIHLVNLTKRTLVDSIPQARIEEVLGDQSR